MLIGCGLAWPAMKPTTRSPAAVGVSEPVPGEVLVFDAPVEAVSGETAATPENSWIAIDATPGLAMWTVTPVVAAALAAYHISPSELWPVMAYAPVLVHELPPESVTDVIRFEIPV